MYFNNIKIFYPVVLLISLFYTNSLLSQIEKLENFTTPRNHVVPNTYRVNEFVNPTEIKMQTEMVLSLYVNAELIDSASNTYNCHGYAWSVSEGGARVWIGWDVGPSKEIYWEDGSYNSVSLNYATKISYSGDHSAVTTGIEDYYISKWGYGPLVKHRKNYCPVDANGVSIYGTPDAGTWRRACDVPQEYSNINSALGNAVPSQTVKVDYGSYTNFDNITIPSNVTLQLLSGANWSIIDGSLSINGIMAISGSNTVSLSGSSLNINSSLSCSNTIMYLDRYSTLNLSGSLSGNSTTTLNAANCTAISLSGNTSGISFNYGDYSLSGSVSSSSFNNCNYSITGSLNSSNNSINIGSGRSISIGGTLNGNNSTTITSSSGSVVSLSGTASQVIFTGSGWGGINVQYSGGSISNCNISGSQYGIICYNSYPSIQYTNISGCSYGVYCSNTSTPNILFGNILSGNGRDVFGDYNSTPFLGSLAIYGSNSFRIQGYSQIYSDNNAAIYAIGNYWDDGPSVTQNVITDPELANDPNTAPPDLDLKDVIKAAPNYFKKLQKASTSEKVRSPGLEKLNKANLLFFSGKYTDALPEYEKLIEDQPDDLIGEMSLVFYERCLEKLERKTDVFDKLNTISQTKAEKKISKFAELRKVYQYMNKGEIDNAISQAKSTLKIIEDTTHIKMALFDLGNMYYIDKKDKPNGEAYYRELIKRFPNDILSTLSLMTLGEWKPVPPNQQSGYVAQLSKKNSVNTVSLSNYPNPFNPSTVLSFELPVSGYVTLKVYDMLGREVRNLIDGTKESGKHDIQFNASNLSSGTYLYRLTVQPSDGSKSIIINKSMQILK